jgi:hypothetical protein
MRLESTIPNMLCPLFIWMEARTIANVIQVHFEFEENTSKIKVDDILEGLIMSRRIDENT